MEKLLYHQKLLNIFTQEELDKIIGCSIYSKDEGGFVHVIVVYTDKIMAEIYADCEAKSLDVALIDNLDSEINSLPARISKDEFLEIFNTATYAPPQWFAVDL